MDELTNTGSGIEGEMVREKRLPRRARDVQNKASATQQITAEQILREAQEMQFEKEVAPPRQQITDTEELKLYKLRKRKEFENILRRQRMSIGVWLKYAQWEERQKEFERCRSIMERLLSIDYRNHTIWLKYAEMEMRNKFINRARNVWDRAVQLLPRIDQLWYKYALMEEQLRNFEGARRIFERWMKFNPGEKAWMSYINLEMRSAGSKADKMIRCRAIYERFVKAQANLNSYIKYAQWELKHGNINESRHIYERAMNELDESELNYEFYKEFAQLEINAKEYERARIIYKYGIDNIPKYKAYELFQEYIQFEKQYGEKQSIEKVIFNKKRFEYESLLQTNTHNYDIWFDYLKMEEENQSDLIEIRELYERAVANYPPVLEKKYWKRYIFLWYKYVIFEELIAKDIERCRKVYKCVIALIPHDIFTFGKMWVAFAKFEIRQQNLDTARKILGMAIGKCPKKSVFDEYIAIEFQLGEFDRCRKIYNKYIECFMQDSQVWINYAKMEMKLDEYERCKQIYEIAIGKQDHIDMPEMVWRGYIDLEIQYKHLENARTLFERLLNCTKHVKVWITFAQFESTVAGLPVHSRRIFERANEYFEKESQHSTDESLIQERVLLLEAWLQFEQEWGSPEQIESVRNRQPKRVRRKRAIKTEQGIEAGYEEYYDYIFPTDDSYQSGAMKLLQNAKKWKKRRLMPSSLQEQSDTPQELLSMRDELEKKPDGGVD